MRSIVMTIVGQAIVGVQAHSSLQSTSPCNQSGEREMGDASLLGKGE